MKPISSPRFARSANKYIERSGSNTVLPVMPAGSHLSERKSFFIRKGHEMVRIYLDEVIYMESMKDYIQIFLAGSKFIYKSKISDMEEELEDEGFLRIHKSYLVNTSKIQSVSPTEIIAGSVHLPIGRSYKTIVMKKMGINR